MWTICIKFEMATVASWLGDIKQLWFKCLLKLKCFLAEFTTFNKTSRLYDFAFCDTIGHIFPVYKAIPPSSTHTHNHMHRKPIFLIESWVVTIQSYSWKSKFAKIAIIKKSLIEIYNVIRIL